MLITRFAPPSRQFFRQFLIPTSSCSSANVQERGNAWRACLGKISRSQYLRHYPVTLIRPDGSTLEIRYLEPRGVSSLFKMGGCFFGFLRGICGAYASKYPVN
ncbi:hypothetical protein COOONC_02476 [Cooperia oncophora]